MSEPQPAARWLSALAACLAMLGVIPPGATAAEILDPGLTPGDLRVVGGAETWSPVNEFDLVWDPPETDLPWPITARYRITGPEGGVSPVYDTPADGAARVEVRPVPGRHLLEFWLEDLGGAGPAVTLPLLFDDARPPLPRAPEPPGWFSREAAARLNIEPPSGPTPVSGIRGYAVSVDREPGRSPCEKAGECRPAETDLRSATGGTVTLPGLPDGVSLAHVVTVSGSGLHSTVVDVPIRVDGRAPTIELDGVPAGWANRPVRILATASDRASGMAPAGPSGPFTALRVDGGTPTVAPGASATTLVADDGVHRVEFYGRDAAGNLGDGQVGYETPESAVVRIDTVAPRIAFSDAQDPADPERIEAVVADALSGPAARGTIAVRPARGSRRFEPLATTVMGSRLIARWDSDDYPVGSYEFRANAYDIAGNPATGERRANGARMVLANPMKRSTALTLGFGGKRPVERPSTRLVASSRGVIVEGRLTGPSGGALGGFAVELTETFPSGAATGQRTTTVLTAPNGVFRAALAAGPSREIKALFAGSRVLSRATSRALALRVPTSVRLRASSTRATVGGAPIVFSGNVSGTGAAVPASGLPVELQFRLAGGGWNEFRTVQTDRRGRFRYPYSFSDDDSRGIRFRFRAYVPALLGWPYEPAGSRPIAIIGR